MSDNLYLVFSQKPDWVSRDDYHAWYVDHAQENIESAGFPDRPALRRPRSAERSRRRRRAAPVRLQLRGRHADWRDRSQRAASKAGDIVLKDWHHDIAFRSWDCQPVGDLLRHDRR